ncbi:uncharacterized protein LOC126266745 [Schistocerca gregaria]|uniref:uncharacterized protein LOC126266745 n=1 Tax=Schistocerca gregaria TaxID=7010 RepID=UPI00211E6D7E|nr:uncharacterized protein LOC126266745 [Schistocerca gregaria]
MARLTLLLVVAAALVVKASPYGDDYGYGGHHDDKNDDWNEFQRYLEHVNSDVRALVKASVDFLRWRGVPVKRALAYALQGVRVLLRLWGKILNKEKDFHHDISSLDNAKKQARHSAPWADKEIKEAEKKFPDLVNCLKEVVTGLVKTVTGILGGLGDHGGHGDHDGDGGHGGHDGWDHGGHGGHGLADGLPLGKGGHGPVGGLEIPGNLAGKGHGAAGFDVGGLLGR